ncbi:DUF190 domain-containing protein, partial [Candidatus Poribacteria bacterium]|nr:DUF190 domain-containing protein [Candidatus Poribacteria bacterium]
MKLEGDQTLLRIYLTNLVRWKGEPMYEAIVTAARRASMAGATVLQGRMGYS